jgi:hypothetical protein
MMSSPLSSNDDWTILFASLNNPVRTIFASENNADILFASENNGDILFASENNGDILFASKEQ